MECPEEPAQRRPILIGLLGKAEVPQSLRYRLVEPDQRFALLTPRSDALQAQQAVTDPLLLHAPGNED